MAALPSLTFLTDDLKLARGLDLWGAYHRLLAASVGIGLTLLFLPEQHWLIWLLSAYLATAFALLLVLRAIPRERLFLVRPLWLLADVALTATLSHIWGVRGSPAPFLFVPIVIGWTLVPQRGLGALSLVLSIAAVGVALITEPARGLPQPQDGTAFNRPLFLTLIAGALCAAHFVVGITVRRLTHHLREVGRLRELAAQREREAAMAIALEEANSAEALGRLAGGIAHDFNNWLTAILGFSELARHQLSRQPEQALEALRQIELAGQSAAALTRQLLDFASRRPVQLVPVDLATEIERCAELVAGVVGEKTKLRLELGDERFVANLDPGGIERILLNLAVNARDAMPEGGTFTIELTRQAGPEPMALLRMSDNGQGMDAKTLPRIFEPFFTTKGVGKGTGLGLASVHGLVRRAGGEIKVQSELGQGTSFSVFLPLVEAQPDVAAAVIASDAGTRTILVVDDDASVRGLARAQLEKAGHAVIEAGSGPDAMELLVARSADIALLITDVRMPGMSGLELLKWVRRRGPYPPVLLVSGYFDPSQEGDRALTAGAAYLAKPYTSEALIDAVNAALKRRALAASARPRRDVHPAAF